MSDSIGPSGEARRLLPDSVGSRGLELEDGRERARFWRLPDLHGLEVLHATYLTHTFARHTHDGFVVGIIERGVEAFYYRGATRLAPAGSIVVVEPGEMHTGQAGSRLGWTYRVLYPEAVLLQRAAVALGGSPDRVPSFPAVIEDPALYALFQQLHATLDGSASALERESGLTLALARLVARHGDSRLALPSTGRERGAVELVRHYLETHYGENPSLDELARLAGLSPFHLLRVFRRALQLPPHAYLTGVRIARAKALLAAGWPVARVATETGFVDQSHLTRQFKRLVGVTPGQYARSGQ